MAALNTAHRGPLLEEAIIEEAMGVLGVSIEGLAAAPGNISGPPVITEL